jgi:hypothetical protein
MKAGKEFIKFSKTNWNNYLNIVSKNRLCDKSFADKCSLNIKNSVWCTSCNTGIGSWSNSCVNKITGLNYEKYKNILKDNEKDINFYEIEIDRNDDKISL